jgi:hypothetical protein
MAKKDGKRSAVVINRAPVLTLWAAVAGLNGYSKEVSLGLFKPFIMGNWGPLIFSHLSPFFRGSREAGITGSGGGDG